MWLKSSGFKSKLLWFIYQVTEFAYCINKVTRKITQRGKYCCVTLISVDSSEVYSGPIYQLTTRTLPQSSRSHSCSHNKNNINIYGERIVTIQYNKKLRIPPFIAYLHWNDSKGKSQYKRKFCKHERWKDMKTWKKIYLIFKQRHSQTVLPLTHLRRLQLDRAGINKKNATTQLPLSHRSPGAVSFPLPSLCVS